MKVHGVDLHCIYIYIYVQSLANNLLAADAGSITVDNIDNDLDHYL